MRGGGYAVIAAAVVVFLGGTVVGFRLLTSHADVTSSLPTCETRTVEPGEDLTSNLVSVDVYNASRTAGLANRVSRLLQRQNFLPGTVSNNTTDITTDDIVIVTDEPDDPRVKLVAAQFKGSVKIEAGSIAGSDGVAVLVGRNYADQKLKKGAPTKVKSDRTITACVPIAPVA